MMSIGFVFWLLMIIWLIFGGYTGWVNRATGGPLFWGGNILLFVLLFLLGWKVFGWPIAG